MKMSITAALLAGCLSCSMLADVALDQLSGGSKGGINTELVVGDKEQVLGTNQDVKAKEVGKVIGTSDNSVHSPNAREVKVTNNTFPAWAIGLIIILAGLVGWLAPRPRVWKTLIGKTHDD